MSFGTNVHDKLVSFELRLEEILPSVGNFLRSNEFPIVGHYSRVRRKSHNVSVPGIDHPLVDGQDFLGRHSEDVDFQGIGNEIVEVVRWKMCYIPSSCGASFQLQQKPLGRIRAIDLFDRDFEKGVFFLEGADHSFKSRGAQRGCGPQFSLRFGLRQDFVVAS